MDRGYVFDGFDYYDDFVFHEQIGSEAGFEVDAFPSDRDGVLAGGLESPLV